jgi:hypothetical protein
MALRTYLLGICMWLLGITPAHAQAPKLPTNKLLHMYELFYLPFSVHFRQGKTFNDIFPSVADKAGQFTQILKPEQLKLLDDDFSVERQSWSRSSLFLNTPLELGESQRITQRLISHRIPLKTGAWDKVSVAGQIQVRAMLKDKPEMVVKAVTQYQFLRSFIKDTDDDKFNFFIIGPSWCESSKEYRYILEYYAKKFPHNQLLLHSVVIEDPQEQIFDSQILRDLFPFPENYSHESVPRFLALQKINGQLKVWEEGDALRELKDRFFGQYRGFMDNSIPTMRKISLPGRFIATSSP